MQVIKNLRIGAKLALAFAAMLMLLALLAVFSFTRLQVLQNESLEISENWLPATRFAGAMNADAADFRIGLIQRVANFSPEQNAAGENNMNAALASLKKHSESYAALIVDDKERKLYETFNAAWATYHGIAQRATQAAQSGDIDAARQIQTAEARPAYRAANAAVDALVNFQTQGAEKSAANSAASFKSAVLWLIVVSLAAAAVALALAVLLVRAITRPLAQAVDAADRVAAGDLSQHIHAEGKDETALLLQSMQRMQHSLAGTVGSVREGAESVASASAEIAQGNADLSARTEAQASSLEQTSATMEELSATVRQNADSAQTANQLAQSASEVARNGGQVVGEVVTTMRGIEDSSKRIADIISVIDGIAFQTNILALNAAVEAARAGEQGRGFAVVASEVRSLAQRSADAAKEIKTLINASVERVQSGTQLVDRAGQTMQDIVASVQRVADIVGEISSASAEQSAGIAQVGEAVTQLDRTTQQNAALVEESAAASESLKAQASRLLEAVASFRIAGQHQQVRALVSKPAPKPAPKPAALSRPAAAKASPGAAARPATPKPGASPPPKAKPPPEADGDWSDF